MIIGERTARMLGLAAVIAASGCGSQLHPTTIPSQGVSHTLDPTPVPPYAAPAGPGESVKKVAQRPESEIQRPLDAPLRAPAIATGDPELDPLVSYLKASFAPTIKDGGRLVIVDTTNVEDLLDGEHFQNLVDDLLVEASDQVPAEMIRDFSKKNREPRAVWPDLTRHIPSRLLNHKEREAIFSGSNEGWKSFYAKYPGSPGIVTVSRVGLNRDKTLALFYLGNQRAPLGGAGRLHVLKKVDNVWIELQVRIGPSWIS